MAPGTIMPAYPLKPKEMEALLGYLFTLEG